MELPGVRAQGHIPMPFTPPRLILEPLPEGVELEAPAGLQPGEAILITPQVQGRWITIGAGPDQDIVVRDRPASIGRSHCRMTLRNGAIHLQGRLQPAGHAINDQRFFDCGARPLAEGDRITIGAGVTFRFTW